MGLNLGDITFGLGANTRGLQQGVAQLKKFQEHVDSTLVATTKAAKGIESAFARQESAVRSALQQVLAHNAAVKAAGAPISIMARNVKSFQALTAAMTSGQLRTTEYARVQDVFRARLGKSKRELQSFASKASGAGDSGSKFTAVIRDLQSASVLAVGPLSGLGARINALGSITSRSSLAIAGLLGGIAAAIVAVVGLGSAAISTARDFQQIDNILQAATGNAYLARKEFEFVSQTSKSLGLEIAATSKQYAKLSAAASTSVLTNEQVREIFLGVAQAATVFDLSAADTASTLEALVQMISKGKVSSDELRRQFAERIPGAMALAAKSMGMTESKFNKLLESGKIMSVDLLPKLAKQLTATFGADAVRAAGSLESSYNKLHNAIFQLVRRLDDAVGISRVFQASMDAISDSLDWLRENLDITAKAVGALTGALVLLAAPAAIRGITFIGGLILSLGANALTATRGVTALGAAFTTFTGPIGWAVKLGSVLARIGLIAVAAATGAKLFGDSVKKSVSDTRELSSAVTDLINQYRELGTANVRTAEALSQDLEVQIAALQERIDGIKGAIRDMQHGATMQAESSMMAIVGVAEAVNLYRSAMSNVFDTLGLGKKNAEQLARELAEASSALDGMMGKYNELQGIIKRLQQAMATQGAEASKATDRALKKVENLVITYKSLHDQLAVIGKGTGAVQAFEDLAKSQLLLKDVPVEEYHFLSKVLDDAGIAAGDLDGRIASLVRRNRQLAEITSEFKGRQKEANRIFAETRRPVENYLMQLRELYTLYNTIGDSGERLLSEDTLSRAIVLAQVELKNASDAANIFKEHADDLGTSLKEGLASGVVEGKKFREILREIENDIARIILNMSVNKGYDKLVSALADAAFGYFTGGTPGLANIEAGFGGSQPEPFFRPVSSPDNTFGSTFQTPPTFQRLPGRYKGGTVTPDMPYLVGEKGPEIFSPHTFGKIIPNNKLPDELKKASTSFISKSSQSLGDVMDNSSKNSISRVFNPASIETLNAFKRMGADLVIPRSSGGAVVPGNSYIGGEKGVEVFVPHLPKDRLSDIMPSSTRSNARAAAPAGDTFEIHLEANITVPTPDPRAAASIIQANIPTIVNGLVAELQKGGKLTKAVRGR